MVPKCKPIVIHLNEGECTSCICGKFELTGQAEFPNVVANALVDSIQSGAFTSVLKVRYPFGAEVQADRYTSPF